MMNTEKESVPPDTAGLRRRILDAVEPVKPRSGFEIACAVVLALATPAAAWCVCQAKLWGGAQMARSNVAVRADREGVVNSSAAVPLCAFAVAMFGTYMQARIERNDAPEQPRSGFRFPDSAIRHSKFGIHISVPSWREYAQKETFEVARQKELAANSMAVAYQAGKKQSPSTIA